MPAADPWWERMECRDADPTIFEEPPVPPGASRHYRRDPKWAEPALALCARCDVRERCLEEALRYPNHGPGFHHRAVIGGMKPSEFDQLTRRWR